MRVDFEGQSVSLGRAFQTKHSCSIQLRSSAEQICTCERSQSAKNKVFRANVEVQNTQWCQLRWICLALAMSFSKWILHCTCGSASADSLIRGRTYVLVIRKETPHSHNLRAASALNCTIGPQPLGFFAGLWLVLRRESDVITIPKP